MSGKLNLDFSGAKRALLEQLLQEEGLGQAGQKAIPTRAGAAPAPLSFAQERLWFVEQLQPGSPAYNMPFAVQIEGALDIAALHGSLQEIVCRHEALRTTFVEEGDRPVQIVASEARLAMPCIDLQAAGDPRGEQRRLFGQEALRPFDLGAGPLFRALLMRLSETCHVLVLNLHHTICDGASISILTGEMASLYAACRAGSPSPLAELPLQYADYAAWQRGLLQGEELEGRLGYWREQLGENPPALDLPLDRPRPKARSFRGGRCAFSLGRSRSQALIRLGRQQRATPFMTLLSAFGAFLQRCTGGRDLVLGSPIANRDRSDVQGLIGLFANMLALRLDLRGDPTFLSFLDRVRKTALGAYAHQDLPFERLVEALQPERSLSHTPLFQAVFAIAPKAVAEPRCGLRMQPLDNPSGTAKFDLSLLLSEGQDGVAGSLEFSLDLFDATTAARWVKQLLVLLDGILERPSTPIAQLPLLAPQALQQLLVEWNDTSSAYPAQKAIHRLFEQAAAQNPQTVALAEEESQLSYGELTARSSQIARWLRNTGLAAESPVGLLVGSPLQTLTAILSVLKAGGAYVPLDPGHPSRRLAALADLAGLKHALSCTRKPLPGVLDKSVLYPFGRDSQAVAACSRHGLDAPAGAESLAYVLFTSGSTGTPKAVGVPHRAVVRLVRQANYAQFDRGQIFLQLAPLSFDASTFEIWGSLLNGARLALSPQAKPSLEEIGRLLARHRITTLWLTAGLFHQMAEHNLPGLQPVRQLLAGGDTLSVEHVRRILDELEGCRLINGYGPTEATTFSCCATVGWEDALRPSIPIGRPISNSRAYILDRSMQPVPPGVFGELYIGGDGLARGYLGRPQDTAWCWVPAPWGEAQGARLYRSGDRVRHLTDGRIEFLGRADSQVKLRGYRVEPGEVEAVLSRHPSVGQCAVAVQPAPDDQRRLAAYFTAASSSPARPVSPADLKDYLAQRLPDFMIPAVILQLAELPLGPTGKVDYRALSSPSAIQQAEEAPSQRRHQPPRSPLEEALAEIWQDLLDVSGLGVQDNFFEKGGHSLLATAVVSRVRKVFGVEVPLTALFEVPTIAGLGRAVESAGRQGQAPSAPPLLPRESSQVHTPAPLSFAQQRLWFLHQLQPADAAYNISSALWLRGALKIDLAEQVFSEIERRHEALRTTFEEGSQGLVQIVHPASRVRIPRIDLRRLDDRRRTVEARQLSILLARRPFDLANGPLYRLSLLQTGRNAHLLLLDMHHIVSDGWSMGIFVQETASLYQAFRDGKGPLLSPLPIQYPDFAFWQRNWLQGQALDELLQHWQRQLGRDLAALDLPSDRPRPAEQSQRGARLDFQLGPRLKNRISAFSRSHSSTLFITLLTAFQTLLARLCSQQQVTVGSPIAGRSRPEVEGLIGLFVNTLALRTRIDPNLSFEELLRRVRSVALQGYQHQDLPFERLVEALQPRRSLSRSPLFQVMFILQNMPAPRIDLPGLTLQAGEIDTGSAKFDLTLSLSDREGVLKCILEYATDLFDATTMHRFAAQFERLLRGALDRPGAPVRDLPLMGPSQLHQLLYEWQGSDAPADGRCLHQLFADQARRTPDAVALLAGPEQLSCSWIARRAAGLAGRLRAFGVGPEARVGVCLERRSDLPAALLAVLEAGGAYVPIDPAYPAERTRFMLEDSQQGNAAAVLVTQQKLRSRFRDYGGQTVCIDPFKPQDGSGQAPLDQAAAASRGNLAYLIYTSGSTGRPKGVAIEHRSAVALVRWAAEAFALEHLQGVLASTSVCFDLSIFEIFVPLSLGGRIILAESALDLAEMPRAPLGDITLINSVPSILTELLQTGPLPATVRTVNLAGESLRRGLVRQICRSSSVQAVFNLYGPSEDTTYSTWARIEAGTPGEPPIGRPLAGTQAYVLDQRLNPVPVGASGQLFLAGQGLARGYHGRFSLTGEGFLPNPFTSSPGQRMYRTGDRARLRNDGQIDFLGRSDHQVKLRGFRIELQEIEAALLADAQLEGAAALVCQAPSGDGQLIAYVEPLGIDQQALAQRLRQALPAYMVPTLIEALPALPRTPNGKVDRAALEARPPGKALHKRRATPPQTEQERLLAAAWADVLGSRSPGREDDFFESGGHSLLAVRLAARLRESGLELPLRAVFEAPALAAMAQKISPGGRKAPSASAIAPAAQAELPLSFAQERLWLLQQIEPGSPAFNLPLALELEGKLQAGALIQAVTEIVRRHAALRTLFPSRQGQPAQVVQEVANTALVCLADLSGLPPSRRDPQARRIVRDQALAPFELARQPGLRSLLVRIRERRHAFAATLHHIVADGWSLGIFKRELALLYSRLAANGGSSPEALPELPVQFADFAAWERRTLPSEGLEESLHACAERLRGVPTRLDLPSDRPRPPLQSFRCALKTRRLGPRLAAEAEQIGRRQGATLFMTLLAVFEVILARWTGLSGFLIGTPVAQRSRSELEGMIGLLVNTVVVRAEVAAEASFAKLLRQVRESALQALNESSLPFAQLVEKMQPERSTNHSPVVQVMFNLLHFPESSAPAPPGLSVRDIPLGEPATDLDLILTAQPLQAASPKGQGDLELSLVYNTDLFDPQRASALLVQIEQMLRQAARDPDKPVGRFSLAAEACLELPDPTAALEAASKEAVPARLSRFAQQAPHRTAIQAPGSSWSYGRLEASARRLAQRLAECGVGRGDLVVVQAGRDAALIEALTAVLRSGAAFLILDPSDPPARLMKTLEGAQPRAWLTTRTWPPQQSEWADWTAQSGLRRLELPAELAGPDSQAGGEAQSPADPAAADIAYVALTSGSTGKPKGILGTHGPLSHFLDWYARRFELSPNDRFSMLSGLAHDPLLRDLFAPLWAGAAIAVPAASDYGPSSLPGALTAWMRGQAITVTHLTPATARLLDPEAGPLAALRLAVFAGDVLQPGDVARMRCLAPATTCVNGYGATETPQLAACHVLPPDEALPPCGDGQLSLPIGRGIEAAQLWVVPLGEAEPDGRLAGVGELGEIVVRSLHLSQGYLNDDRLTRRRFLANPLRQSPDDRLYRTGDLGRYLPDGSVRVHGRIDRQIKIRGLRVEPAEIERCCLSHPEIVDAAVEPRPAANGDQRLVAYLAARPGRAPAIGGLVRRPLPNGLAVAELNRGETDYLYREIFDLQAYLRHGIELRDGDCIFDVGANIGLFMLFAHQLCRSPRLYCFEPNPEAFEVLSANARLCSPQPQLFNYGISDADKTVPFTFFTGMSILSGVYADRDSEKQLIKSFFEKRRQAGEKEAEEILLHADDLLEERLQRRQLQCRLRPLSDVMAEAAVQRIDLLKINVEKSELDAVAGVHSQDWAKIRQVVLEVDLEEHLGPVCEVLQKQGYETAALQDELLSGSGLRYVYAARPDQCPSWRPSGRPGAQGRHLPAADAPPLLSSEELGRHLRKRLPGYMVPSAFVFLDELPRTARGKIDRAALPDPSPEAADTGFQAPQTATQVALAAIWQELLGVPSVGSNDDFFTRGGHSLLATRLLARLSKAFGVELPLRQLFETPRLAQLAAAIDARRPEGEAPLPLMEIGPAPEQRHEPFPLTPIQQAYWVGRSGAFELGNVSTHLYLELESPDVDLERFEKAWQRLVDRHDMLRAVVGDDGQQRILSDLPPYRIEVEDLSSCSARQAEERWVEVRRRMSHQVLPADRWPLFELRACRLPAGRTRLHVSFDFLIADAWSIRILLAELGAAYAQPSIALQPLSLSFRDYVLAEKRLEGSQQHQRSLAYWRSRAGQLPPGPELPLAGNPAGLDKPRFVRRAKALPAPVWQRLQKRAAQAGLTPSGVLLAAFAETLSSWSKSPHFTLVLTLFNRLPLHPQVDCLVGDFTSLSLLERRPPESRQESFQSCARRLQQQLWDDLDHRFVSGVEVLRERTRQSGSLGGAAAPVVFTSTLGLGGSSAAPTDPSAAQLPGEMVYSITQTPQILLDHQVMEQGGKLIFNWDAVDDLFPPRMLDDAFAAYCRLLDRLASQEQAWAEAAPLPLPPALSQLIEAANATQAPLPEELRLQELFFSQARRQPDAAAVLCRGRCLSYSELALQAKAVGRELRSREALPNTLVAVVMNKGWEQVAAVLGVLASGAAYLPIDPSVPAQRLHMLLEHSHVRVALTQPPIDRTLDWPQHVERIILEDGSLQGKDVEEMPPVQQPDDLAYVIFTSGSTGMPKGVMIDHRGAANTILDLNQRFDIGCTDRVLALSALTFDLSVYDIFGLLATGGAVVLPEPSAARDPQRWTELLTEHGVTVWNSVPTLAAMWADSLPSPGAAFQGQLRLMMLSGDWIPVDLPDRLRGLAEGLEVISLGGATEASIWSILFPIGPVDPAWQSIPYGKPLRNQTFHVLDEELRPKPVWATGQLYIGGLGVAQGYWGDQQRSRQSFVVHPESAERLYRTGDLGRWLPDGNIEFLGREDFQVKVQGYRIELGEVEAALARQPQVRKAVVTAIGERMGSKALVAYVVPQGRRNQEAHIEPPEEEASLPLALEGASPQLMLHPGRQLEFKLSQPGLRRDEGRPRIALSRPSLDEALLKRHTARRSERRFLPRPVPLDSLARLLSCLMQVAVEGQPLPKHRYPSAGSLYPVQAYLDVMPGRIDGLAGGTYYYHPQRHRLERLWEEPATDPAAHAEVNRPIFAQSAFTLLLVADLDAIRPLYGDAARNFCLLEAGYMGQLLMEEAAGSDIGLCPVGGVDFERLRPRFQVGSNHLFLHALLGGPIERAGIPSHRAQAPSQGSPAERPAARSGSDHAQLASTLRQALARSLPEYMLPAHFVVLEDLPLTANGKVDRRSLPLPGGLEDKRASGYVAPRDEMEQAIAAAWQKVLGRKSVGVEDNFFDLGGTSVEIVRLHAELQQATGRAVSLVALFNYPTVNAMARYLSRQGGKQGEDDPLAESRRRARVRRARRGRQPGGP